MSTNTSTNTVPTVATRGDATPQLKRLPNPTVVVSLLVFRRWSASAGLRPRTMAALLVTASVAIGTAGLVVGLRIDPGSLARDSAQVGLLLLVLTSFFGAWGVAIFVAHNYFGLPPGLAFLRFLPVGRRSLRIGSRLPAGLVAAMISVSVVPGTVVLTERMAGYGLPHAFATVAVAIVGGAAAGRITFLLVARTFRGPLIAPLRLTLAYVVWLVAAVGGLALLNSSIESAVAIGSEGADPLNRLGFLVWPVVYRVALDPDATGWALVAALTALLVAGSAVAGRMIVVEAVAGAALRRTFDPTARSFLVRLTVTRLMRHPRTREAVYVSAVVPLLSVAAAGWSRRISVQVDLGTLRVLALSAGCSFGALVRGLSARRRPIEARWGFTAGTRVASMIAAVVVVGAVTCAPVAVSTLMDGEDAAGLALVSGALLLLASLAVLVSTLTVPALGSGGNEAVATILFMAVSIAAFATLARLPAGFVTGAAGAACALGAYFASVAIERSRRGTSGRRGGGGAEGGRRGDKARARQHPQLRETP